MPLQPGEGSLSEAKTYKFRCPGVPKSIYACSKVCNIIYPSNGEMALTEGWKAIGFQFICPDCLELIAAREIVNG